MGRKIKLFYLYYFFISATKIKTYSFFILFDLLFLIILPLFFFLKYVYNNNKIKKIYIFILFIMFFYFLQIIFIPKIIFLQEFIYFIPIILGCSIFYNSEELKKKDYNNLIVFIVICLISPFLVKKINIYFNPGIFNTVIGVGVFSLIGFYILEFSSIKNKNILRIFFLIMIIYSNTRGSLIALLVFLIFRNGIKILKILKVLLILISSIIFLKIFKVIKIDRLLNKYSNENLDILTGRPQIWYETFSFYMKENILGSGVGHYNLIKNLSKKGYPENIHNGYLDLIFSFGIFLGVVLITVFFLKLFSFFVKSKKNKKLRIYLSILLSLLVLNIGESVILFTRVPTSIIFWIILGKLDRKIKEKS